MDTEENGSNPKAPRRVKRVETVREKVEKSNLASEKVKKSGIVRKVFRVIFWPFRMIGKIIMAIGYFILRIRIGKFRPFHFLGLILVPRYFRNSWKELKLVTWPTRKESRRLTLAVMIFAVVFGVLIAVVDYGLDKVFKRILLKS